MICGVRTHRVLPAMSKYGGFTLVEVLAAVLILSIGLLASISAIQACRTQQRRMQLIPIARSATQATVEYARAIPFDDLESIAGEYGNEYMPEGTLILVEVSKYPAQTEQDLKKVTVTTTWPDGTGTGKIKYETLLVRK